MHRNNERLAVVFFGMAGRFSLPPLEALLADEDGVEVRAVVVPADPRLGGSAQPAVKRLAPQKPPRLSPALVRDLPMLGTPEPASRTLFTIAADHSVPVLEVARLGDPAVVAALAELQPDAICVACFPRRLPPALLGLPRLGCLNVHPSLLPENRGPDPLFWTFRRGDTETGVTIHLMDEGLDSGPILAQQRLALKEGMSGFALEFVLARFGGSLLVRVLHGLHAGTLIPQPQDAARATTYTFPEPADFVVTGEWSARHAYNFMHGARPRDEPVRIAVPDAMFTVAEPLDYDETATLNGPWRLDGDILRLRCMPGVVRARVR